MEAFEVVPPSAAILRRAAEPLATPLATLDAIHLATATFWRDAHAEDLIIATHNVALAAAARASGFHTIGV
jgi:predicted nucleic acid-binding protein